MGVGYLYKSNQVAASDSVLMFILAQVLGSWAALTSKIFRIPAAGSNNSDNA